MSLSRQSKNLSLLKRYEHISHRFVIFHDLLRCILYNHRHHHLSLLWTVSFWQNKKTHIQLLHVSHGNSKKRAALVRLKLILRALQLHPFKIWIVDKIPVSGVDNSNRLAINFEIFDGWPTRKHMITHIQFSAPHHRGPFSFHHTKSDLSRTFLKNFFCILKQITDCNHQAV